MSKTMKRMLSMLVVAVMVLSMLPTTIPHAHAAAAFDQNTVCEDCGQVPADGWKEIVGQGTSGSPIEITEGGHYYLSGTNSLSVASTTDRATMIVDASDKVCLHMNGQTTKSRKSGGYAAILCKSGTLNILGTGTVENVTTNTTATYGALKVTGGTVNVYGGTYVGSSAMSAAGGTLNIYNATVNSGVIVMGGSGVLNVYGGTFDAYIHRATSTNTVNISGGTFKNGTYICHTSYLPGTYTITGGTFNTDPSNWVPQTGCYTVNGDAAPFTVTANHTPGEVVEVITPATCTAPGETKYACANGCGETFVQATEQLRHTYENGGATCDNCEEPNPDFVQTVECPLCHQQVVWTVHEVGNTYPNGGDHILVNTTPTDDNNNTLIVVPEGTTTCLMLDARLDIRGRGVAIAVLGGTLNIGGDAGIRRSARQGEGLIYVQSGTVNLYGASIYGSTSDGNEDAIEVTTEGVRYRNLTGNGGNIYMDGGTFNMYRGAIYSGTASGTNSGNSRYNNGACGGNVFVGKDATFNMYGGTIRDGVATSSGNAGQGGNVFVVGKFNMEAGTISGGTATSTNTEEGVSNRSRGGNVYMINATDTTSSQFTMTGGTITGGTADQYGGNISMASGSLKLANAAAVTEGTAPNCANIFMAGDTSKITVENWTGSADIAFSDSYGCGETIPKERAEYTGTYGGTLTVRSTNANDEDIQLALSAGEDGTFKAQDHAWVEGETVQPDCENGGYTEYECSVCGNTKQDDETPATNHAWGEWDVTEATCLVDGSKTRECANCDASETEVIPAAGEHAWGEWDVTEATCLVDGSKTRECANCDASETEVIPAAGEHAWGEWDVTEATCLVDGSKTRECANCDATETEVIPAVGHKGGEATCTAKAICDVCKQPYGAEPEGHKGGEATCTDKAICDVCKQPYGAEPTGHVYTYAQKDAEKHFVTCKNCSYVVEEAHDGNDVCICGFIAKVYVAEIEGVGKYETLADAIAVAPESDDPVFITLLNDVQLDVTTKIPGGKNLLIDLNGKNITGNVVNPENNDYGMLYVAPNATLLLVDITGTGSQITNTGDIAIGNYGTVAAAAVEITGARAGLYNFYFNASLYGVANLQAGAKANVIWNSGELSLTDDAEVAYVDNSGALTIEDNAVVTELYLKDGSHAAGVPACGTVQGDLTNVAVDYDEENYKLVTENGETKLVARVFVAQVGETKYESLQEAVAEADGKTVTLLADVELSTHLMVDNTVTLDLNGKKIFNSVEIWNTNVEPKTLALIRVGENGNLTIIDSSAEKTGTILPKEDDCYGIIVYGGTLTIKAGTIVGNISAVHAEGGYVNIEGGHFYLLQKHQGKSTYLLNIQDGSGTQYAVSGGTFVDFNPFKNTAESPKVNFAAEGVHFADVDGDNIFTAHAAEAGAAATCTTAQTCVHCDYVFVEALGHTDGAVVVENNVNPTCTVDGSYENVVYCTVCDAELSRDAVTVPALGHTDGEVVVENNVDPTLNSTGSYDNVVYCTVCGDELSRDTVTVPALKNGVAAIGDTHYATLEEAVAAAPADATVTLLTDATGNGIKIDKNITIDLGGNTYTIDGTLVGSPNTQTLAFQLLNGDITITNGTITSTNAKMLIQNYSNLTLEGVTLDGTQSNVMQYVLSNNCGDVEINNSTIKANDGVVAFDVCDFMSYATPTVTVTDSTIIGEIEIAAEKDTTAGDKLTLNLVSGNFAEATLDVKEQTATVTKGAEAVVTAPEDYKWVDNTLVAKTYRVEIEGVGQFETIAEAIAAGQGNTIKLIADIEESANIPAGKTLDLNGFAVTGTVLGKIAVNGGTYITAEGYKMIGANANYYYTTDAVFTMTGVFGDIAILSGTVELVPALWYTGEGQTLTIAEGAKFIIPEGKTLYVNNSTVNINGTAVNNGTLKIANGAFVKGNITGAIQMAGGTFATGTETVPGYTMAGVEADAIYYTENALFTIEANYDTTIVSGTMKLNLAQWWTLPGQKLVVESGATFEVPAGTKLSVNGSNVVVDGDAIVEGTVELLTADATVAYKDDSLLENFTTPAGDAVLYVDGKYIVHDHVAGAEATCLTAQTCTGCDYVFVEALDHEYTTETTAPTCLDKGYTTYTCIRGDHTYVADYVDALGHDMDEGVVTTQPTCTADGEKTFTCERENCGYTETEKVDKLDHEYTTETTAPTCLDKGYTTYTCIRGDHTYVADYVDALGHTEETIPGYDPQINVPGLTDGKKCTVCGATTVPQEEIPALTGVAMVNGVGYETLAGAVAAAGANDIITLYADIDTDEIVIVKKPVTIKANGFVITEDNVACMKYTNADGEKVQLTCNEVAEGLIIQAVQATSEELGNAVAYIDTNTTGHDGEELTTLQAALDAAAANGQTVRLTGDPEIDGTIIIPGGVTLDIQANTVTIKTLVGLKNSIIRGGLFAKSGAHGKLAVDPNNLVLAPKAYVDKVNSSEYDVIPVYYNGNFVFTRMEVNTDTSKDANRGLKIDEETKTLKFQFVTNMTGDVRKNILVDGADDNEVKIIVRLQWVGVDADGNPAGMAYQDFVYNDDQVSKVCDKENQPVAREFGLTIKGYDALEIDINTLEVKGMVITNSGVEVSGDLW